MRKAKILRSDKRCTPAKPSALLTTSHAKAASVRAVQQPASQQTLQRQPRQQPVAPPVYKPQPVPKVLQTKKAKGVDALQGRADRKITVTPKPGGGGKRIPGIEPRVGTNVIQRMEKPKYTPPHLRSSSSSSSSSAAAAFVPALKYPQALPLYNWLSETPHLTLDQIVDQKSDYVTLQLAQKFNQHTVLFNVHNYFGKAYLGGTWVDGIFRCALNGQENPRSGTLLNLWLARRSEGSNPSLSYDAADQEWDLFFDAEDGEDSD